MHSFFVNTDKVQDRRINRIPLISVYDLTTSTLFFYDVNIPFRNCDCSFMFVFISSYCTWI